MSWLLLRKEETGRKHRADSYHGSEIDVWRPIHLILDANTDSILSIGTQQLQYLLITNSAYSHSTYKKNKLETKLSSATGDEHRYIDTRIQKATIVSNMADRVHRSTDRKKREQQKSTDKAQDRTGTVEYGLNY